MNIFTFVTNIQSLTVIALTMADIAGNINIWQEVHFYFKNSITLTGFASTTFNIKGETPCFITTFAGSGHACEQLANWCEYAGIGCWI